MNIGLGRSGRSTAEEVLHGLGLGIFIVVVLGPLVPLLWSGCSLIGQPDFASLLVPSGRRLDLFLQSITFSAAVALAGTTLGMSVATFLIRWSTGWTRTWRWLVLLLAPIPPYVHALAWSQIVGLLGATLGTPGGPGISLLGWVAAWWVQTLALLPIAVALAMVGLDGVETRLTDAARIWRNDLSVLFRIVLPLASPAIVAGGAMLFLLSVMDYSIPSLFGVNVYTLEIFSEFSASNEPGRAFLLSVPLLLVAVVVVLGAQHSLRRLVLASTQKRSTWAASPYWPAWFRVILTLGIAVMLAQIAVLLVSLFQQTGSLSAFTGAIGDAVDQITFSVLVALLAALCCLPLAIAMAVQLVGGRIYSKVWWGLAIIPLAVPAPLVGIGLIGLWSPLDVGVYGSDAMPVLVALARFTPFAILVMASQWRRIDLGVLDSARLYQSSFLHTWRIVLFPMLQPGLLAAAALMAILALSELGATLIVVPPGRETLTIRIYNYLHYGGASTVAGLCLLMTLLSLFVGGLVIFGWWIWRNRGRREMCND